ncbi:MAG: alpha/beta fold hydrolase [Thiogranum sp.]|nr:alpha/beta fold hydrolase [Thiogranum sp.]
MTQIRNLLHSLSVRDELTARHRPSGHCDAFQTRVRSIDEYLEACRRKVEAARTDLDGDARDWIIEGNSPFVLKPDGGGRPRRAVLMVHGLTDAPFLVRDIGAFFRQQGFYVLGMQLPGHGTRPGDLLEVRWQDWRDAHRHLLDLLAQEADELYLLGFSAGAVLNLYQTLLRDDIKALLLFSPAIRVRRLAQLTCLLKQLGRRWPRFAWADVQPDTDCFKYESLASNAICQVYRMIDAFQRLESLKALEVPLFVAASENDVTINSRAALAWFGRQACSPKRMLYYSTGQPAVPEHARRVAARLPEQGIKSYAHTALLQSPDNPHYGADGSLRFCTHYYHLNPEKYRRCKAGAEDCAGEMFTPAVDCGVVRRLTWNPQFGAMLDEIRAFLDAVDAGQDSAGDVARRS